MVRENINKAFINLSNLAGQMTDSVPHQIIEYGLFFGLHPGYQKLTRMA